MSIVSVLNCCLCYYSADDCAVSTIVIPTYLLIPIRNAPAPGLVGPPRRRPEKPRCLRVAGAIFHGALRAALAKLPGRA